MGFTFALGLNKYFFFEFISWHMNRLYFLSDNINFLPLYISNEEPFSSSKTYLLPSFSSYLPKAIDKSKSLSELAFGFLKWLDNRFRILSGKYFE